MLFSHKTKHYVYCLSIYLLSWKQSIHPIFNRNVICSILTLMHYWNQKRSEDDEISPNPSPDIDTNDTQDDDEIGPNVPPSSNPSTRNIVDLNSLPLDPVDRPPIVLMTLINRFECSSFGSCLRYTMGFST
ncbi:hypothetical protein QVD17_28472 [Tagetes erecta]|uniref:Uncharacterized protein n=1 Tax=Tagetes erecta TaxID=13708 RepID=A0AAD8KF38_TARER|nr:hypothetical protein QVD17_28472 [Tagetes erecta]